MWYKQLLDGGQYEKQEDLARALGVSRSRVASVFRLLSLDEGIQEFILGLDDEDELLAFLTERRLRVFVQIDSKSEQRIKFRNLVQGGKTTSDCIPCA